MLFSQQRRFNTQPPKGGWVVNKTYFASYVVSTHSRLKAAGEQAAKYDYAGLVSTHSRLKAAGLSDGLPLSAGWVSTHSRLKAAGPAHGCSVMERRFQHTAA